MDLVIPKKDLLRLVDRCQGVADKKSAMPALANVLLTAEGNTLRGVPIVVITSRGARSGALRKNPVMRVEHDGAYAAIASNGAAIRKCQCWSSKFGGPSRPKCGARTEYSSGSSSARASSGVQT